LKQSEVASTSLYGQRTAQRFAAALASYGITVVSGLARGIDASAHRGALEVHGRTIAVLGSGLLRCYPEEHVGLAEHIAGNGAVVSEFPLEMDPHPKQFPRRNRIISGLAQGVVVVEAGTRSGALVTADAALEQGRDVFAVPGPVDAPTSRGSHTLLQHGAGLATCAEDILQSLGWQVDPHRNDHLTRPGQAQPPMGEALDDLLAYITQEPTHINDLCHRSGVTVDRAAGKLLAWELAGTVRQLPGQRYIRV